MLRLIKKIFRAKVSKEDDVQIVPQHFHIERRPIKRELPDFDSWMKIDIAAWAKDNYDIKLDRRNSKNSMIEELKTQLEKKES